MLQILYLIAFVAIAFLALRNLVANVITLGVEERKASPRRARKRIPHPELLDEDGNLTEEPLLVIRSASLEEARSRLEDLYSGSPDED
ncbi:MULTISPECIES: DUF2973 domain-containing protein [unclassified Synechococcus]|jgi:hypothetical protein|uniref:DUF2973 domain-containing protein n=1 Tax=unclassified Synechococcus TaxID=2626047 RepID=UPI0000694D96|nr:DUF2973 domain-containing protein [Synechococcus sp. JA-2-3B'a(2-13)]ABD02086.1 conserved hypothetical protein [Synechococcus sp. JA-2-3B'a(2-13)]HIK21335.1 DUF2973 domain-containing protein [Synechococcus sp. M44_DOE_062]